MCVFVFVSVGVVCVCVYRIRGKSESKAVCAYAYTINGSRTQLGYNKHSSLICSFQTEGNVSSGLILHVLQPS